MHYSTFPPIKSEVITSNFCLIFSWIQIPNLANHSFGQVVERVANNLEFYWNYHLIFIKIFIDSQQYSGTYYLSAGRELPRVIGGKRITTLCASIILPIRNTLLPNHRIAKFCILLCSEPFQGRIIE